MKFTKMHGTGNDYVYVNCFEETVENAPAVARFVSDRHFGIGSDGLILIKPGKTADFEMEMYNADGSRAEMCGNGIRCVAKYVYDKSLTDRTSLSIESMGAVKYLELTVKDGKVDTVRVDMGAPILAPADIPADFPGERAVNEPLFADGTEYRVTCVSVGNPHTVTFVDDVEGLDLAKIGPKFEHHEKFPERVNTEFVKVIDRKTVQMRVWERGSGETYACGTGSCATAVACILNGLTDDEITVKLIGGDLLVRWDRKADKIYMTGPAVTVFDGEIELPSF